MTRKESNLLIKQAAVLVSLGTKVESKRQRLKQLVENGVPFNSFEMIEALNEYEKVDSEWKLLEAEHLALKMKLSDF